MVKVLHQIPLERLCQPERMERLFARIGRSRIGRALIEDFRKHKRTTHFDHKMKLMGSFVPDAGALVLQPWYDDVTLTITLLHELRHSWECARITLMHPARTADDHVALRRILEADADTIALMACHELAEQGDTAPLAEFANTPHYRSIAGETTPSGAFRKWLSVPNLQNYADHASLQWLEQFAKPASSHLPPLDSGYLAETLGDLLDGQNRLCAADYEAFIPAREMSPAHAAWLHRLKASLARIPPLHSGNAFSKNTT